MGATRRVEFFLVEEDFDQLLPGASFAIPHTQTRLDTYDVPTQHVLVLWGFGSSTRAGIPLYFRVITRDRTYYVPTMPGEELVFPPIVVAPGQNVKVELFNPSAAIPYDPFSSYVVSGVLVPSEDYEELLASQHGPYYPPL